MLYYLFQWLDKYDFPGAGMFGYTSFRSLMAIILALLISSIWGDKFINLLNQSGQPCMVPSLLHHKMRDYPCHRTARLQCCI